MSKRQSTKREWSIWNNHERKWYAHTAITSPHIANSYVSWQLPLSLRTIEGVKAPYYVSRKQAEEWLKWLDHPDLSIQKQGTYKEIRARVLEERRQIKAASTHGIWDIYECGGRGGWTYTYALDLPKSLCEKYHLNEDWDGVLFVSSEDVAQWYLHLMSETEPEDATTFSIQLRSASKKVIRARVKEEKRRTKFASELL